MNVGVSLLRFKYSAMLKKFAKNVILPNSICQVSMCHPQAYSEPCQRCNIKWFLKSCEYTYAIYDINSVLAYWPEWKGDTYQ